MVTQRWSVLLTPIISPFHQGLWNVADTGLGPNKIIHFLPPKKEKKDKFLHQALTATDKKSYRNQGLPSPLPVPALPRPGCRALEHISFHEPLWLRPLIALPSGLPSLRAGA